MTNVLGWMPQELLGKNFIHEFVDPESRAELSAAWDAVMMQKSQQAVYNCKVRSQSGQVIPLNINIEAFLNPYSEEMEFIICTHTKFVN